MAQKITALKVQKRNPNRVNIYLDGNFAFGLSRVVAAWLEIGQLLEEDKIAALQKQDTGEVALQKAIHYIGYRPRSETEVRQKLATQGFEEWVIDSTVARLTSSGLVSDQQFTRTWVENRTTFRPRSRRALAVELRQKGVADDLITETLDEMANDESAASRVAQRQASHYATLDWQTFRQRLSAYLARRGFTYDVIAPLVRQSWCEMNPSHPHTQQENEVLSDE